MIWLPTLAIAIFFIAMYLVGPRSRVSCPDCGTRLPLLQSPLTKTKRQWIEGGFLCNECGCESDISGHKVKAGTMPGVWSAFWGFALVAIAAIPALLMLLALNRS